MKVVTVGDNCIDYYEAEGKAYPGGNPVNVAVYLKQLGVDTSYIGWVGTDSYGDLMVKAIAEKGVDLSHVTRKTGNTAVTYVEMIGNDRKFGKYDEGVMAEFSLTNNEIDFMESFQLVHSAIWGRSDRYYLMFKYRGLLTSFDFSDYLDHPLVETLSPLVDFPFFSYKEDDEFIRQFLQKVKSRGSKVVIATLGENGSLAYDGKQFYKQRIVETNVVDTMGAGDAFISGFIYGVLSDLPIDYCLRIGAVTAARTVTSFGAW